MRALWRSTASSRRRVFNSLLRHISSSPLQGEAMQHACGQSMETRCAGGNEENTRQQERWIVVDIILHGVYLVLDVSMDQLLSVMMPKVRTIVKWSMTMPKKGGMAAEKRQAFTKALLHIKIKMC